MRGRAPALPRAGVLALRGAVGLVVAVAGALPGVFLLGWGATRPTPVRA